MSMRDSRPPKPKLRWYQFSLRRLMVFVLICGVVSAWVGWKLEQTRRELMVVARIESLGGSVVMSPPRIGSHWITRHFGTVTQANLSDTQLTDAGLESLKGLPSLDALDLPGTQITDAGLEHLKHLPHVSALNIGNTQVTDAGLEHLKGLTTLETLKLDDTQVTDEGVRKLQQALPNCEIKH